MPTIAADYFKLNDLTKRLGLTWKMDESEGFDPHEPEVLLITASGKHNTTPLDLGSTADTLNALFELGILTDVSDQQPDVTEHFKKLEDRITALEESLLPNYDTPEPAAEISEADHYQQQFHELEKRAKAIGNNLYAEENEKIIYRRCRRHRRDNFNQKSRFFVFTQKDALNPKRFHMDDKWRFNPTELDELERFITRDEELYQKHFTD